MTECQTLPLPPENRSARGAKYDMVSGAADVLTSHKPWFLLEMKMSDRSLLPALAHFQAQTQAVVAGVKFRNADCAE